MKTDGNSNMDGISTVRIGTIGLNAQRDKTYWAKGPSGTELLVAKIPGAADQPDEWMATVERDEESILAGVGPTPHDAAQAAHADLLDLFDTLAELLADEVE